MKLVSPSKRPLAIAIIGMPRTGSTIVGSFFNSLDGAFIVGEPHSMVLAPRPFGHDWPARIESDLGVFELLSNSGTSVLEQIKDYALGNNRHIFGFKEVCTVDTNPAKIAKVYGEALDAVFVVIRDPRTVFHSIAHNTRFARTPPSPVTFFDWYRSILSFCNEDHPYPVHVIRYEDFIKDPVGHVSSVSGWEFEGDVLLVPFPGVGDGEGRSSKVIRDYDIGKRDNSPMLNGVQQMYEEFLVAMF